MANAETLSAPLPSKEAGASAIKEVDVLGEKVIEGSKEWKALTQQFESEKKYMYELAEIAPERVHPVIEMSNAGRTNIALKNKKFIPKRNIILTSQIVWKGERRNIRYYDGCTTIFADKQPQDKALLDQLIAGTNKNRFHFIDGKWGCEGYERWLLIYMNVCSWNVDSPFRTKTAGGVFRPVNQDAVATATASLIDQMEEALKYAREAKDTKMLIHAAYLGIPTMDYDSGNDLTPKEIRALYRKRAADDPETFIKTYGNQAIEIQYYIDKALMDGTISNKFNPNKATWGQKNTEICDISGLKSNEAISQRIFEFSQTEEGTEFVLQLKALYS